MYITVCAGVADSKKVASKGRNGHQRFHQDSNNRGKSAFRVSALGMILCWFPGPSHKI